MAPTLQALQESLEAHVETRLETRIGELALAQSRSQEEALAPVATRLNALEQGALATTRTMTDHKAELETLRASLGEFRQYLETFAGNVETRLQTLTDDVAALRAGSEEAAGQRQATDQRLAAMLQAIDQENRKVRRALRQLAGDDSPDGYVVQKGDSLYAIARRHNIPLESLEKANPKYAKTGIHPGDRVIIPPK
jgi:LysM repeat protein